METLKRRIVEYNNQVVFLTQCIEAFKKAKVQARKNRKAAKTEADEDFFQKIMDSEDIKIELAQAKLGVYKMVLSDLNVIA